MPSINLEGDGPPLPLPNGGVDKALTYMYRKGQRGALDVIRAGQPPMRLDLETEFKRIEATRLRRKRGGLEPKRPLLERVMLAPFSPEAAIGVVRIRVERHPNRKQSSQVLLEGKVLLPRTSSPIPTVVRLLFLHGFRGTLEIERPGCEVASVDMPTAIARAAAGTVVVGRPKRMRRKR